MCDDDSYWLNAILWIVIIVLAIAVVFVVGLVMGLAFLLSGLAG